MGQRKRPQQLAATEGVLLNAQDFTDILNSKIIIRNEEVRVRAPSRPPLQLFLLHALRIISELLFM